MGFGKNVKAARLAKGYSKEFVAVNVGVTVATLDKYESELRNPPLKKAGKIADIFGLTGDVEGIRFAHGTQPAAEQ